MSGIRKRLYLISFVFMLYKMVWSDKDLFSPKASKKREDIIGQKQNKKRLFNFHHYCWVIKKLGKNIDIFDVLYILKRRI